MVWAMRSVQLESLDSGDIATTQDFTLSGFGTPTAWVVTCCYGTVLGTIRASASLGVGWDDGTQVSEGWVGWTGEEAEDTAYASGGSGGGTAARMLTPGTNTGELIAAVTAITDGVRLTYSAKPTTPVQVRVELILCDDAEADTQVSTAGTVSINLAGAFEPTIIITQPNEGISNGLKGGLGFACQDRMGTITQGSWSHQVRSSTATPANLGQLARTGRFALDVTASGASFLEQSYVLDSFDTDGFTFSRSVGAGALAFRFLALRASDTDFWCGWESTATSVSTKTTSTPGFAAGGGWLSPTFLSALDTIVVDTELVVAGFNAWNDFEQYSASTSIQDASDPCVAASLATSSGMDVLDPAGAHAISGTVSFAALGFAVAYSDVDATARFFLAAVFSSEPVFLASDDSLELAEEDALFVSIEGSDTLELAEESYIVLGAIPPAVSEPDLGAKQAGRSGMEQGLGGRSGMEAGQGGRR